MVPALPSLPTCRYYWAILAPRRGTPPLPPLQADVLRLLRFWLHITRHNTEGGRPLHDQPLPERIYTRAYCRVRELELAQFHLQLV